MLPSKRVFITNVSTKNYQTIKYIPKCCQPQKWQLKKYQTKSNKQKVFIKMDQPQKWHLKKYQTKEYFNQKVTNKEVSTKTYQTEKYLPKKFK